MSSSTSRKKKSASMGAGKAASAKKSSSSSSSNNTTDVELQTKSDAAFKRRSHRFSEVLRHSVQTSTGSFSSARLSRRSVREKKGLTELLIPGRKSTATGAPLNDSKLQVNVIQNFCTYLEKYALGIDGIFTQDMLEAHARNIAQVLNQDPNTIDFQSLIEPPDVVASALRAYLESHRKTVIPSQVYDKFVEANSELEDDDRIEKLRKCVVEMPTENRQILSRLLRLFHAISENAEITGMDVQALSALFGDTMLHNKRHEQGSQTASGADMISFMIENYYAVVFKGEFDAEQQKKKKYKVDLTLNEDDWKLLLINAKLYQYKKGQVAVTEGEPNMLLFRVRHGSFRMTKGKKHIATLKPLSIFGEVAFLGSYLSEATVVAAEEGAQLWILDLQFIRQMFSMEPELCMKFYHYIAQVVAKRVQHLTADGGSEPYVPKAPKIPRGVSGNANTKSIATETSASEASSKPTPFEEELVVKDYHCKLDKEGVLYIMQHYMCHVATAFARERKKLIPLDYIGKVRMTESLDTIEITRRERPKLWTIVFDNTQDCDECFALIETLLRNRKRDQPFNWNTTSRAVALYDFNPQHEQDLPLKVNDLITVLQKRPDGWWFGECNKKMGYFPSNYVRDDEGLPTFADWNIVWMGAKEVTAKKGEEIVGQDESPDALYQILKGSCTVTHENDELDASVLSKEETFGEESFLIHTPSTSSITAASKCTLRKIPHAYLQKLFINSPALAARVYKYLAVVVEMKLRGILDPPKPVQEAADDDGEDAHSGEEKASSSKKGKKGKNSRDADTKKEKKKSSGGGGTSAKKKKKKK